MKQKTIYSIIITLLIVVITIVGSTYAYYSLSATGDNTNVTVSSEKYEVIYHGGEDITSATCPMQVVSSKEGGCNTTVEIGLAQGVTVAANANFFIDVISITDNLKIAGFKWEIYSLNGQTETLVNSGNFASIPANNQIQIASNLPLSTTLKQYKIYIWVDGNLTDNEVLGSSFSGAISASTDVLTGTVRTS